MASIYDWLVGQPTQTAYVNDPDYIRALKNNWDRLPSVSWLYPQVEPPRSADPHTREGQRQTRLSDQLNPFSYSPSMTEENYRRVEDVYNRLPPNYAGQLPNEQPSTTYVPPPQGQPGRGELIPRLGYRNGQWMGNALPETQQGPLYQPGYREPKPDFIHPGTGLPSNTNYLPFHMRDTMSDRLNQLIGDRFDDKNTWWISQAKQGPLYQPYRSPQEPQQGPLYQPYLSDAERQPQSPQLDLLTKLYGSNNYLNLDQYNPAALY